MRDLISNSNSFPITQKKSLKFLFFGYNNNRNIKSIKQIKITPGLKYIFCNQMELTEAKEILSEFGFVSNATNPKCFIKI